VQRRLALLGDGMGHVAIAGVGLAFLTGTEPVLTALIVSILGAFILELVRHKSKAAGDLALALIFYGGIAGGVLLTSLAGGKASTALNQYLFGSLSTVSTQDFVALGGAAIALLLVLVKFGTQIFAMSLDAETAKIQGIRVTAMSVLLTAMAAVTVVVGMRTVGLLLVSAIMIVPVAAAQQLTHRNVGICYRSFLCDWWSHSFVLCRCTARTDNCSYRPGSIHNFGSDHNITALASSP
ncbi:MAG: metal ABC transporter permease, partial [Burkholderiaceae bacterium]|nr:metal ABC transporter permease [Burkholderiaceae bacterium]